MAGYSARQSSYTTGDTITAAHSNDEFNQVLAAFNATTGHTHDGTAGEGGPVTSIRDANTLNRVLVDSTNNHLEFYVNVSSSSVQQFRVQDGAIVPITDNDIDLGTSSLEFKDLFIDGTANVDTLAADAISLGGTTITSTGAELNILDGVTSTAAELNILDGVTSTAAELNLLDGITAGTVSASLAVIADSNKDISGFRNLSITGDLTVAGDDITMGTNTAGNLLVADGTNFNSIAVGSLSEISTVANDDVFLAVDTSGGGLKKIARSAVVAGLATSGAISNVVEDTTPQLGGNLDMNGQDIVTTSNADLELAPNGTGHVTVRGNTNSGAIQFNCESNSHGQILKAQPHSAGVTNEMLLPDGADSTLVSLVATQTLTNKTLTSPKINENVAVTATATEINLLDGDTARGTTSVSDTDGIIHNDAGTMRMTSAQTFKAYVNSGLTLAADNLTIGDAAVTLSTLSGDITIDATANDTDIIFKGTDNSSDITMLTLDGSEAGEATFNAGIVIADAGNIGSASDKDAIAIASNGVVTFSQTPVNSAGAAFVTDDPTALAIALG